MTARRRFCQALEGPSGADRVVGPMVAADHAAHLAGLPVSQVVRHADLLAGALTEAHRLYQGDFVVVFADVCVEAEAMGCRLEFPHHAPPHVLRTLAPEELRSTDPRRDGRLPLMLEVAAQVARGVGDDVPVFASIKDPFSAAALACGTEDFLALLVTDPDLARQALDRALANQARYAGALLDLGLDLLVGAPLASGGIVGPKHFADFIFEPICELMSIIRRRERLGGVHLCGEADPVLDQLARLPAHFLSLESFDPARWKRLAEAGPTPAMMGWFPTGLLLDGTPEAIAAEAAREIADMAGYPHLLATACDVPQFSPPEKVLAFVRAGRAGGKE
ncbi:MAG: hypothetical protein C4524_07255 [Candidatus Zixiibacteriota bacterium]|nr:MAG: hypothetical protein C4524_07255 [candidate division Zixibacteria bacterium]